MTAFYIFASCFLSSLATSIMWRLWTQRSSNQEADQQVNDQIANGMTVLVRDPFHSTPVEPGA